MVGHKFQNDGIKKIKQSEIRAKCQIQTEQNKGHSAEVNNDQASILECHAKKNPAERNNGKMFEKLKKNHAERNKGKM